MAETLIYCVSGHGYGHARRSAEIIAALSALHPGLDVRIRSTAPRRLFEPLPAAQISESQLDAGMAEVDAMTIDVPATLDRLEHLIARREKIVADEVKAIGSLSPKLVVCDAPFLAGYVAERVGVPCVLASNFTWDWICEPLFGDSTEYARRWAPLREVIRAGYAKMNLALRLPFGDLCDALPKVVPVPLVATRGTLPAAETLRRAGLPESDRRPRVLVSVRGGMPDAIVARAAAAAQDFQFILPGAAAPAGAPANLRPVTLNDRLGFSDVLGVSQIVLSKLGYGTVAECIAARVRLLWPRRAGFREDDVVVDESPRFLASAEIGREDFREGRWGMDLRRLMALPPAPEVMRSDGAQVCAGIIDGLLAY